MSVLLIKPSICHNCLFFALNEAEILFVLTLPQSSKIISA